MTVAEVNVENEEDGDVDSNRNTNETINSVVLNGSSCNMSNTSDVYLQLSRKGILSCYGNLPTSFKPPVEDAEANGKPYSTPGVVTVTNGSPFLQLSMMEAAEGTVQLKPSINNALRNIRMRIVFEVICSFLRNLGCYALLATVLYFADMGDVFFDEIDEDWNVAVLVIFGLGVVALPFQIAHALWEWKARDENGTVVAGLLRRPVSQPLFRETASNLRSAAPYVGAEIRFREELFCRKLPLNEIANKVDRVFHYDSWGDATSEIVDSGWRADASGWLVVVKDYRLSGSQTETWFQEEVEKFKRSVDYDANRWRMTLKYVLDLQEGTSFPDAQCFLIHPPMPTPSAFYSLRLYKVLLCLCLDFVYHVLFYIRTKKYPDHKIVKVVLRHADNGVIP